MSEVLYRKYRPQGFKEVLGQDHIVAPLEGAIEQGNISHAYLFSGTRGTGKTTLARIVARSIGVSDKDLYEIDAASNRGIDDIRELRDAVNTLPFESPYKVYIIDEVHMLTKEAFNALLKTLEEPPQHAVFILATTEVDKLPETIISRCQSFVFKKPSQNVLSKHAIQVSKKEGVTLDTAAADLVATLAEGSFRDALGVLQKVIFASADKKISIQEIERITGAPKAVFINDCLRAIDNANLDEALQALHLASEQEVDMKIFMTFLLHKLRSVLLLRFASDIEKDLKVQFTPDDFAILVTLSKNKESHINATLLKRLLEAYGAMGYARIPQLPLELALIETLQEKKST